MQPMAGTVLPSAENAAIANQTPPAGMDVCQYWQHARTAKIAGIIDWLVTWILPL